MAYVKKIRILHVAQAAGGVDRYLKMLLKYLDKNRFENIVIASHDYKQEEYRDLADHFEYLDMERSIGYRDLKAAVSLRKRIRYYQPDSIYAHSSKAGALCRLANLGLSSLCVYNPHGWSFMMQVSNRKRKVYVLLERGMAFFTDQIVCISEAEKNAALQHHICKASKLHVIKSGVDIQTYRKRKPSNVQKKDLHIPETSIVVGMVGRLEHQKGADIFLKMAELLLQKRTDIHFLLVGSGAQKQDLLNFAGTHGFLENVHITDWVQDPYDYIELFDIAVLLSRWEGFGLVIPEYMLCQKPIVATFCDAIPELIQNGQNGFLVPKEDAKTACDRVLDLLDDKELQTKFKQNGLKKVYEQYDIQRVSKAHEVLFEMIQNQGR